VEINNKRINKLANIEISNAIALLEECVVNGNRSPGSLYAWFLAGQGSIESTIRELKFRLEDELNE
jgi:hypothetical protein